MKHIGSILEFTDLRNAELMRAYRSSIAGKTFIDISQVAEEVANSPTSRFWVSEERAAVVISAIERGVPILDTMRPLKREMFEEIYRRAMAVKRKHPDYTMNELAFLAVNSPAPKFYLCPRCAMDIIYKIRNGYYDHRKQ